MIARVGDIWHAIYKHKITPSSLKFDKKKWNPGNPILTLIQSFKKTHLANINVCTFTNIHNVTF